MTFLHPWTLFALPLIGLPILIHLLFRQKYRVVPWGAMMFLVNAQRHTKGMARIRYWIILALRMTAVGTLLLAASRPLTSGFLGFGGAASPDTTLVLIDRSPSMECHDSVTGLSKRETGLRKLAELFRQIGHGTRLAVLETTRMQPLLLDSPDELWEHPQLAATGTTSDIPGMVEAAFNFLADNASGRADLWIVSDLRQSDWNPDDGRWLQLFSRYKSLDHVRLFLLAYPDLSERNFAVQVKDVRRRESRDRAEIVVDFEIRRDKVAQFTEVFPVEIQIGEARSVLPLNFSEQQHLVRGHVITIDKRIDQGWGCIQLPHDDNLQDNLAYFSFANPPPRHTLIVSSDEAFVPFVQSAVLATSDPELTLTSEVISASELPRTELENCSMILWQDTIPDNDQADSLRSFVRQGRPIVFFPPPGAAEVPQRIWCDGGWGRWMGEGHETPLLSFRGDSDLWAHSAQGMPLPVGSTRIFRYREILGGGEVLARLQGGTPLLVRKGTPAEPLYFLGTLPQPSYSSLGEDGISFYVLLQRALQLGALTQGTARQLFTGDHSHREVLGLTRVSASDVATPSTDVVFHSGVFQGRGRLVSLNRPFTEDNPQVLTKEQLARLNEELEIRRLDDRIESRAGLSQEIWRLFLLAMLIALLGEAFLCLPEKTPVCSA